MPRKYVFPDGTERSGGEPFTADRLSDGETINFPPGWLDLANDDELAQFGIKVVEVDAPPSRRMIEKSVVMERLTDEQLETALSLMTSRQKERWRMPGHPQIYVDDPELLALLSAIGADADKVLA